MSYEKHYGSSEAYDGLGRLEWLKELAIDQDGHIISKRILSNHHRPLNKKYSNEEIKSIQQHNTEIEQRYRGGRRLNKKKRTIRKRATTKRTVTKRMVTKRTKHTKHMKVRKHKTRKY
jgi:hypothetical protein